MNRRLKIGIITWHYYSNFGSALQSLALQEAIRQLGNDVEFVNYRNIKFGNPNKIKDLMKCILDSVLGQYIARFRFGSYRFCHHYLHQGHLTTSVNKLATICSKYDVIVCGSDQIWAPNVFNPVYFCSFIDNIRKISYAASIGLNDIPEELVPEYKRLLSPFSAISIREDEGKNLLKRCCNIDSTVVLDPTLLHEACFYRKIQKKVRNIDGEYLFCYFLNDNHNYRKKVEKYAKQHNLNIVGVSENVEDSSWMNLLKGLGADHFLWLINHAHTVMTDSYHGTIFSLLFHKNFYTFVRFLEDSPICQNSRIRQLQNYFGKNVRVIGQNDRINEDYEIDYDDFENRLEPLRMFSLQFLKKALQSC